MSIEDRVYSDRPDIEDIVQGLPLYYGDGRLKYALLEVGYKNHQKRKQVKRRVQKIKEKALQIYGADIEVYIGIVNYSRKRPGTVCGENDEEAHQFMLDLEDNELDFAIRYKRFSSRMLELFHHKDKAHLIRTLNRRDPKRTELRRILATNDPNDLERFLTSHGDDKKYCNFKGRIAELMAQKDIEKSLPDNLLFIPNYILRAPSDKHNRYREIDGLFAFYDVAVFRTLLENLRQYKSIELGIGHRLRINPNTYI